MDFGPYDVVPSSDVPEMVEQQNSWNSLVIGTWGIVTTIEYSRLEVGWHKHGFHYGFAFDCPQVCFDLGDREPTHEIFSLHTRQHQLQGSEVC
jgi:hypothetical protein